MGLDWVVLDKEENGRTIDAWETLGARRLNPADGETVLEFRKLYERQRELLGPPPTRKWWQLGSGESAAKRKRREYWSRPFQEVLDDMAAEDPPPIMIYASPENEDGLAFVIGAGRECDFRGNELRSDRNAVIAETEFADTRFWNDMSPEEMREVADDLEAALRRYRATAEARDEEAERIVDYAVRWLRFWSGKGHALNAWA